MLAAYPPSIFNIPHVYRNTVPARNAVTQQ